MNIYILFWWNSVWKWLNFIFSAVGNLSLNYLQKESIIIMIIVIIIIIITDVQPFVGPWLLFQFLDSVYTVGRTSWTRDRPVARPLPNHRTTQTHTDIHTSSGIQNHDPSVRASEDSSCLRTLGHCDRQKESIIIPKYHSLCPGPLMVCR
jgi:hypothetical protein